MRVAVTAGMTITTEDYHTGGEPFRIVTGGIPELQGDTVAERRLWAAAHLDDVRRLLVNEPRGHADMYGGFVTPPDDPDGDLGVVFFHNDGFSTACGHGTIALATWAVETGRVTPTSEGEVALAVDVPSGRLHVRVPLDAEGRIHGAIFRNVPSFVSSEALLDVAGRPVPLTVAFGGAFYGIAQAADLGLHVDAAELGAIIAVCRDVKAALNESDDWVHPEDDRLNGIYGVILVEDVDEVDRERIDLPITLGDPAKGVVIQRNVTVFADGEVDRSATGSGTSARLAALHRRGQLPVGQALANLSIVDSVMIGVVEAETAVGIYPAVSTLVGGQAFRTGTHTFTLDPRDRMGTGFLLR